MVTFLYSLFLFFFMDVDSGIINKISNSGPILPIDVHKQIGLSVLFTAAHLNEMVRTKRVKMTKLKKGSSPFYYLSEKPEDLERLTKYLKPFDKGVFDLIKNKKVLRDSAQKQDVKLSLKNLQDFAIPLYVTFNSKKELFWKYFLVDDSEVSSLIKEIISVKPKPVEKKVEPIKDEIEEVAEKQQVEVEKPKIVEKPIQVIKEVAKEQQTHLPKPTIQEVEKQIPYIEEVTKPSLSERVSIENDSFFVSVKDFFDSKQIVIKDYAIVKKESEIDFSIDVPSAIGVSEFFCRAKNKKRVNDGDLSTAFVTGQIKKVPVLFISHGDLTKKAQGMIDNEFKNQVFFKRV